MSHRPLRIEIAAGLGTGKTTAARLLANAGLSSRIESHEHNPFIKAFYRDPSQYAFETEMTFLMQHYHDMKGSLSTLDNASAQTVVFDYSPLLDKAYADVTLQPHHHSAFMSAYDAVKQDIGTPDILIHLTCSPERQMQRIHKRGRSVEQDIPMHYIQQLSNAVDNAVAAEPHYARRIITIDTDNRDLCNGYTDQGTFLQHICYIMRTLQPQQPCNRPAP